MIARLSSFALPADGTCIPADLITYWQRFRLERARLRQAHLRLTQTFWKLIPRRKLRCMPVIGWTHRPTRWEPEPLTGLVHTDGQPYIDKLGLTLRWRVSGLTIEGSHENRAAIQIWLFDHPSDTTPPNGLLQTGGIITDEDQATYRHYWNLLNKLHTHYIQIGRYFELMVMQSEAWRKGTEEMEECVGMGVDTMAADGNPDSSLGMRARTP